MEPVTRVGQTYATCSLLYLCLSHEYCLILSNKKGAQRLKTLGDYTGNPSNPDAIDGSAAHLTPRPDWTG